jgi:ABC-type branched-subunit amino acid transport system ATPase component
LAILSLDHVHAYYGKAHILQGVSLEVERSSVVGIFGRNGAGKTTLLRTIMNLVPRAQGTIRFGDRDLTGLTADARTRAGIVYMSQDLRVFPDLTVRENCMAAREAVQSSISFDDVLGHIPELTPHLDRPAGKLSGGQQQLVGFARSLLMGSDLFMLDEPTEGLMPLLVKRVGEIVRSLKQRSITVLLVEQNVQLGMSVCDHIYFLEKGRIIDQATPSEIQAKHLIERYLGVSHRSSSM